MSLREKQTAARRHKMLDAAESLIRKTGGTGFSLTALAKAAEVGPATPYRLFGSKEAMLFELMSRNLKSLMNEALIFSSDDPLEQVIQTAEHAVDILLRDQVFLRPLYQTLLGLTDPVNRPKFLKGAFVLYRRALNGAMEHKLLANEQESAALTWSLMAHFTGVLYHWAHESIDDDLFRAHVIWSFVHLLLPLAHGKSLKMLQKRRSDLNKVLCTFY